MRNNTDFNKFFSELNILRDLKIEEDLGNGFVRLKVSEAERRQALQDINCMEDVVIELLRNSRDAGSKNIFISTKKIGDKKRIIHCIDDGLGIPPRFHNLIFQSRVTSKLEDGVKDNYGFHGRGMALFSIKLNVEDIKITFSDMKRGTCIYLEVDLENLPEKKDQSIMPHILDIEGEMEVTGGVNNIIKTILEFAVVNNDINFYYGSPTQIISTIREISKNQDGGNYVKFNRFSDFENFISTSDVNILKFPFLTDSYTVLGEILKNIFNIEISQRGLQRIIYNEIIPIQSLNYYIHKNIPIYYQDKVSAENQNLIYYNHYSNDKKLLLDDKFNKPNKINKEEDISLNGKIELYDELKLANRFKDDEIRYIINIIEKEIKRIGSKYLITLDDKIEYKKANNTIKLLINLKQKN
ncbi:MAG: hypothetical protein FJW56_03360 [Actinobacteria bacterium]|nr:hypothetical protein [Actinomycetota bacterium]